MNRWMSALLALSISLTAAATASEMPTRVILDTVTDPISGHVRAGYTIMAHVHGSCWEGSLVAQRPDAWRCIVGNELHDPCYGEGATASVVYCADGPRQKTLLAIVLTKPLPMEMADRPTALSALPSSIDLPHGVSCGFASGATGVVAGLRMNYFCADGRVLLGAPNRSGRTWSIYAMPKGGGETSLVSIPTAHF